jgi:hypothetical protein
MAKLLSGTRVYGTATVDSQIIVNGSIEATQGLGSIQTTGGIYAGLSILASKNLIFTGGYQLTYQPNPVFLPATTTLTTSNIFAGVLLVGSGGGGTTIALTLPTNTIISGGFNAIYGGSAPQNLAYDWYIINTSTAVAGTVTLAAGSAHNFVGSATIYSSNSGLVNTAHLRTAFVTIGGASAWTTFRIG